MRWKENETWWRIRQEEECDNATEKEWNKRGRQEGESKGRITHILSLISYMYIIKEMKWITKGRMRQEKGRKKGGSKGRIPQTLSLIFIANIEEMREAIWKE